MATRRFGLMSDTHGSVHPAIFDKFAGVEAILHAGDVGDDHVLTELRLIAAVHAVAGNVDYSTPQLPLVRVVDLPFGKVGIAHGHRYSDDREARVRDLLGTFEPQKVRLVLYGHSHIPHLEVRKGIHIVNPGAASRPRFGVPSYICLLEWEEDHDLLNFQFQSLRWS